MTKYIKYGDIQAGDSVEQEYRGVFTRLTVAKRSDGVLWTAERDWVNNDGGEWELLDRPSPYIEGSVWYINSDKPRTTQGTDSRSKRKLRRGDRVTITTCGYGRDSRDVFIHHPSFIGGGVTPSTAVDPKFLSAEPLDDVAVPRHLYRAVVEALGAGKSLYPLQDAVQEMVDAA